MGTIIRTLAKIAKRVVEELTKPYFCRTVLAAYRDRNGEAHRTIQAQASICYGIQKTERRVARAQADWYMDFVFQAQLDLFRAGSLGNIELPPSPVGFNSLRIHCSVLDSNSSVVYLLGFSDNLAYFDIYRHYVQPGTLALDVGANIGIHSLVMSRCAGTQGAVISFEPLASLFARLNDNIALNGIRNIRPRNAGVGSRCGAILFDSNVSDFNIGKARVSADGDTEIELTTIDEYIRSTHMRISLVKIDTEGYEQEVLRGGQRTLQQHKPVVVCEFNHRAYGFAEFREMIPFKASFFKVPISYRDHLKRIEGSPATACDVLVVPNT